MSMTTRREPRETLGPPRQPRPHPYDHQPDHGHQPLPLDTRPSIWATRKWPAKAATWRSGVAKDSFDTGTSGRHAIVQPATSVLLLAQEGVFRQLAESGAALDASGPGPGAEALERVTDARGGPHCPRRGTGGAQRDTIERRLERPLGRLNRGRIGRRECVQVPAPPHTLQRVYAAFDEREPRARYEVVDGARYEYLIGHRHGAHACADVHAQSGEVTSGAFELSGMHAGAH